MSIKTRNQFCISFESVVCIAAALLITALVITGKAYAQSALPECEYTASDYDGDGFGWENSGSCLVTDSSQGKPNILNWVTGEYVDLIRPYWNAYRDIENRVIECKFYRINRYTDGKYELAPLMFGAGENIFFNSQYILDHQPLSASSPWSGVLYGQKLLGTNDLRSEWTVNDGVYYSDSYLGDTRYIELIDAHNGAIRKWENASNYHECYALDGRPFQPTGYVGESRPEAQPTDTEVVAKSDRFSSAPILNNKLTDTMVSFSAIEWDMAMLYGQSATCNEYTWSTDSYRPGAIYSFYADILDYYFFAPPHSSEATSSSASAVYRVVNLINIEDNFREWSVVDGQITEGPEFLTHNYVEVLGSNANTDSFRYWTDDERFYECETPIGALVITGANSSSLIDCDYRNAALYNGWGWNPVIGQSCPPLENKPASNCDYINADVYNGWGWDPVARMSCAPQETDSLTEVSNETTDCVDSDGDGWGWDGIKSCLVDEPCLDTDGDGWGWDGVKSCRASN